MVRRFRRSALDRVAWGKLDHEDAEGSEGSEDFSEDSGKRGGGLGGVGHERTIGGVQQQ